MKLNIFLFIILSLFLSACAKEQKLPKKCYEKQDTGKCRAYFINYYYNQDSKSCEKFVYGGCGGNVPFNKLTDCKKTCEK
ncbi:MAG: hypothetical protein GY932_12960 [Arcobacter sp.]|nr:hypothetical protein [Arcobacter sp.]